MLPIFITVHERDLSGMGLGKPQRIYERRIQVAHIASYMTWEEGTGIQIMPNTFLITVQETVEEIDVLIEQARSAERDEVLSIFDSILNALDNLRP